MARLRQRCMGSGTYERELVNALTECDVPALRAPSSGSATARDLPDVLAGRPYRGDGVSPLTAASEVFAIEVKTGTSTTHYIEASEADGLARFATAFGATPFAGAKFKRQGGERSPFYLVPLGACRMTPGGNYGVPESDAEERARALVYPSTRNEPARIEWRTSDPPADARENDE